MTAKKKQKIAICLHAGMFVKAFSDTGAIKDIIDNYDVIFLMGKQSANLCNLANQIVIESPSRFGLNLLKLLDRYSYLSLSRHRDRSTSFALKFGNYSAERSLIGKILNWILTRPGIFEVVMYVAKQLLFPTPKTKNQLKTLNLDLILVPSNGTSDAISMDIISAAKSLGIPSLFMMYNWDNVTCKGVYPFLADYASVWGQQSVEHYHRIHRLPLDRIYCLGSPQFEVYERFDPSGHQDLRVALNFSPTEVLAAYLGGARYRDDILLLRYFDAILERLNIRLVYRPHPFQDRAMLRGDFFKENFRQIVMDPSIVEHYQRARHDLSYNVKSYLYNYDRFPHFLKSLDFVISSYSTMCIESMKMGKPVLLTAFSDPTFHFSFDKLRHYEHHNCWANFTDVVICEEQNSLESAIEKTLKLIRSTQIETRLKEEVKYVAFADHDTYSARLLRSVHKILDV